MLNHYKMYSAVNYVCICNYLNGFICYFICMYICTLCLIILRGIGDMTAKKVAVRVMTEDDFPHGLEPGNQIIAVTILGIKVYNYKITKLPFLTS